MSTRPTASRRDATSFAIIVSLLSCVALAQTPAPVPTPVAPATPAVPASEKPESADEKKATVDAIEVTGKNTATDVRRNSTASKIVITREDIQQYGDSNVADVMRRLPGVTQSGRPGRGGPPAMRGMGGGMTQILIDGQRIPPGFSLDQLSPEQVDRIEILRAPTAETGARAIAGTINVVLREPIRKTDNDLQIGVTEDNGVYPLRGSFSRNDTFGANGTWTLTVNGDLGARKDESTSETEHIDLSSGAITRQEFGANVSDNLTKSLFVNARAQWRLGQGEQLGVMVFSGANQPHNTWVSTLNQTIGTRPAQYATRNGSFDGRFAPSRVNFNLNKKWDNETRYELRGGVGHFEGKARLLTRDTLSDGTAGLFSTTNTDTRDDSWNFSGKITHGFGEGKHSFVAGAEIEGVDRAQTSVTLNDGVRQLVDLGEEFDAATRRIALYAQDEWEISTNWSANLGVRYETIQTSSKSNENDVTNTSRVLTPLGHLVWRFDAPRRDQLRLSLTQSYRSPNIDQILARPWLNTAFPVPGANTITTPDRAGNPALRPERANGIDLAYEMYFKSGGNVSVNLFRRNIRDLIRNVSALETVSWATSPRYVSRPQNLGDAVSQGVEFDAKFSLTEFVEGALPLNFRLNGAVFDSKVKEIPGPNNRISEQPKWTANIGGDYRFRGTPISTGATLAFTPGGTIQQTDVTAQTVNFKRVLDAYLLYTLDPQTKLRLSASNLTPAPTITENTTVTSTEQITSLSNAKNYRVLTLRLEMKF